MRAPVPSRIARLSVAIACAASALAVAGCGAAAPPPVGAPVIAPAATEAEVRDFILRYNAYYAANDLDNYFASFDPGLTQWWPSGRVDLKTYENMWRKLVANGGGTSRAEVSDLQIQVSPAGDAAVATYVLAVTPRKNGQPDTVVERNQETDVLYKINGAWKIVHVNYGPAKPA